ncbi:MAG: four-carbon acid sugar kinase family protein [Sporolactobacillus sp.]
MENYLIIADDFTGSNDTGVQLTKRGIPVRLQFTGNFQQGGSYVLDTESRNLSADEAYKKVSTMMNGIDFGDFYSVVKKVDSTLRGNLISEIRAIDHAYQPDLIVFCPSLPALSRTVRDKILYVNGIRALNTDFARDPIKPILDDNIYSILQNTFPAEKIGHIRLDEIRSKQIIFHPNVRVYSSDAVTNKDIQIVIEQMMQHGKHILWIGSAGVMDNLVAIKHNNFPSLGLIGSVSEVTREQLHFAEDNGTTLINVPIYDAYEKESYSLYVNQAIDALRKGNDTVIMSSASYDRAELDKTRSLLRKYSNLSVDQTSAAVQSVLGGICRRVLSKQKVSGLFITGGDTAKGLFDVIKADGVEIIDEVAIGVPMMRIIGGEFNNVKAITKAGAFGNPDLLVYSLKKLSENNRMLAH